MFKYCVVCKFNMMITMAVYLAISEIFFSVKEKPDVEIWVKVKVHENCAVR